MPSTLKIEYPNEDSKPFHDPALLRYALESAKEIKGEAIIQVNGDGW